MNWSCKTKKKKTWSCLWRSRPNFLSRLDRLSNSQDMLGLNYDYKMYIQIKMNLLTIFFSGWNKNIENKVIAEISAIILEKLVVFNAKLVFLQLLQCFSEIFHWEFCQSTVYASKNVFVTYKSAITELIVGIWKSISERSWFAASFKFFDKYPRVSSLNHEKRSLLNRLSSTVGQIDLLSSWKASLKSLFVCELHHFGQT